MAAKKPVSATLRAYQVGFGDAFLLTFAYGEDDERHVLIDFGTTKLPEGAPKNHMQKVADDVAARCGGALTAVVATHRHQDHVSGFSTGPGAPGATIAALKPKLVLQPWTEAPDLPTESTGAKGLAPNASFAATLAGLTPIAKAAVSAAKTLPFFPGSAELGFLGENNLSNASAVKNLMAMGKGVYLSYGKKTGLEKHLPGVTVTVLGPPTIAQYPKVEAKRAKDADDYWHIARETLAPRKEGGPLFRGARPAREDELPLDARWFVPRVRSGRAEGLLELVRRMDDYMNNTSLVLLFEVGETALLFPGDAQIENWEYLLDHAPETERADLLGRLRNVTLYKVGHHGSLNATPKRVWERFDARGAKGKAGRLATVMSTLPGKHGSESSGTEVPREKLVAALQKESDLTRTDAFPQKALFRDVTISF